MKEESSGFEIQIASDLHIELFRSDFVRHEQVEKLIKPKAKHLALCGDIGTPGTSSGLVQYEKFLKLQAAQFPEGKVFVLAGNHEFYVSRGNSGPELPLSWSTVSKIKQRIHNICDSEENLIFLDRNFHVIGDVRIVGVTLWSRIAPEHADKITRCLMDYHVSFVDTEDLKGYRKMTTEDTLKWHAEDLEYVKEQAVLAKDAGQKMLVLSHHVPLIENTSAPIHEGSDITSAFSTDLTHVLRDEKYSAIKVWVYGHTHYNSRQSVHGTQVVSNQKGYFTAREDTGIPYDPEMTITL